LTLIAGIVSTVACVGFVGSWIWSYWIDATKSRDTELVEGDQIRLSHWSLRLQDGSITFIRNSISSKFFSADPVSEAQRMDKVALDFSQKAAELHQRDGKSAVAEQYFDAAKRVKEFAAAHKRMIEDQRRLERVELRATFDRLNELVESRFDALVRSRTVLFSGLNWKGLQILNGTMLPSTRSPRSDLYVRVHHAWLIVLTAALPALLLARLVHRKLRLRRLRRRHLCTHCGYDLRASPNRCPECGTQVSSGSTVVREIIPA
jgi:hypothetical protein